MKKSSRLTFAKKLLLATLVGAAIGFFAGLYINEQEKERIRRFLNEAKEMPFRLFV